MPSADRSSGPLIRYLVTAALVRTAVGGAAVGLFSLTVHADPTGGGTALGGLLAALLTAPYVAGPWLARMLDGARDGRVLLALSFVVFGVTLAASALLFGHTSDLVVAALIAVAGLCGPLVTGGLSSRLASIAGGNARSERRAEGWDSATYGIGNTFGPAAVGAVGALAGPLAAVVALGAAAVLAAGCVLTLPASEARAAGAVPALHVRETMRIIATVGQLRRVMVAMMLTALVAGGITVIATVLGGQLAAAADAGPVLAATYGLGYLAGSVVVGLAPPRGEPERVAMILVVASAVAVAGCALAPNYLVALGVFALAGAASATLFTATLAVRSVYSPPRARAQVYVSMGGVKMAVASAGTALAGVLMGFGPRTLLTVGAGVTVLALVIMLVDRRLTAMRTTAEPVPAGGSVA